MVEINRDRSDQTSDSKGTEETLQQHRGELEWYKAAYEQLGQRLRSSEKHFRLVTDSLQGKVSYVDSETRYQFVSKQYGEWSRISPEKIVGQTVKDFMGELAYARVQEYVEAALAGRKVTYEVDWAFADGSERYLVVNYIPDINEFGEVLGFFVIMQDLTERQKAERILRQFNANLEAQVREHTAQLRQALDFEERLKRITDKVRDTFDESQILQTVVQEVAVGLGATYCNIALYNLEEATSKIYCEYTNQGPSAPGCIVRMIDFPEIYPQLLQGQYLQFCELVPSLIKFSSEPLAVLACPVFDNQGILGDLWLFRSKQDGFNELEIRLVEQVANQCAIAIGQARLYQASQAQVAELEKLNRLKDDFLSTVSHELRTPVTNMRMAIRMLVVAFGQDETSVSRDKALRYLQILQDECERETELINDLLDLQRLEAGDQTLKIELICLPDWLIGILEPFQERARAAQQTLQLDIAPTLPTLVSDASIVERILAELLNNACKYTPSGETIRVMAQAQSGVIQFQVNNSGTEIPRHELPRIFDKFYRVPHLDQWKHGGTGLGLALVLKLTERLGGSIWAESGSGQTCFTVELPLR